MGVHAEEQKSIPAEILQGEAAGLSCASDVVSFCLLLAATCFPDTGPLHMPLWLKRHLPATPGFRYFHQISRSQFGHQHLTESPDQVGAPKGTPCTSS